MSTENYPKKDARRRIAENIRRLRTERGLSQEEMAELADFHRTYVSQLERCVTNISIDGLERLATALAVDVLVLLEDRSAPALPEHPKKKR
jgi:transcriptional regulator with XRE-family HTH domain